MAATLDDPAVLALIAVLFAPAGAPIAYLCTRRAVRSWRRWTR